MGRGGSYPTPRGLALPKPSPMSLPFAVGRSPVFDYILGFSGTVQRAEKPHMCGYIGIFGPDGVDVAGEIYEGLLAVQHRGQDAAGIITFTDSFHVKKGLGLVLE